MVDCNTSVVIHVLLHGEASQFVDFLPPRKDSSRNLLLVGESKHFRGSIKMQQCSHGSDPSQTLFDTTCKTFVTFKIN